MKPSHARAMIDRPPPAYPDGTPCAIGDLVITAGSAVRHLGSVVSIDARGGLRIICLAIAVEVDGVTLFCPEPTALQTVPPHLARRIYPPASPVDPPPPAPPPPE
ncbi:MAG: hypothetical protein K2Y37_14765 [Pirellulales bacterium]|nr:hypothetical protein [Pirellulales bacterium]